MIGTLDDVPAATLLLPYFEVDPVNSNGITTILKIRNASSDPVVAHLTFWSNLSVPVLNFDVYLTGFDEQSIDLRDVLVFGNLPTTGPSDFLSPRGARSGPHSTFGGSCSSTIGSPPAYSNPALPVSFRTHVQAWLSGHPSALFGTCASTLTDHLVGYVTIDAMNRCTLLIPSDAGYFASGGAGVASNRNVLWGDWTLFDSSTNSVESDTLVHIEASADDPLTSTPGSYTFYGRYTGGAAADNREPLPARWYAPLDPLAGAGGTKELLVWRDSGRVISAFNCNTPPSTFPLGSTAISVISQDGVATPLPASSFPWETQRIPIAQDGSWLRLDLNTSTGSIFDPVKQAHVIALRQDTGMGAVQEAGTGRIGTADRAPGASLLLPYFEVDTSNPNGIQTAAAVHNSSPSPVLAHVVLWTDLSVPTLGFDLYLPGLGSRVIDLKDIFLTGSLPASGPSPLPGCGGGGTLPPLPLSPSKLAALNVAHMGGSSQLFGGLCAGLSHGDGLARGYLTVDVVTQCTSALPGQPGYFGAGGAVGFDNVLWGDYVMMDPANNLAHGDTLVHLQASTTDPLTAASGRPTFYGRYVAWSAADHREALPSTWGASSRRAGVLTGGASLLVWRDSGQIVQPFTCGAAPAIFPLGQGPILHFDETGQDVPVPPFVLGLEAQKRAVDWTGPGFGTLTLELGTRTGAFSPPFLQSYVTSVEVSSGRFALSIPGVQLPSMVLFMDGFESGNFVAWSSKVP